jgi:hypothetical protein
VLGLLVAFVVLRPLRAVSVNGDASARVYDPAHVGETSDAWDYLQQARQIYRGDGFTSLFTYVPYLPSSRAHVEHTGTFPQLWRQPGYPLLLAGSFALAGAPEPNAVLAAHAFAIVLLPVVTFAFARKFIPAGSATVAGALAVLTPLAVGVGDPLAPTVVFVTLLTATLAFVAHAAPRRAWIPFGVMLGLLALLRLETWLLVPGVLVGARWWMRGTRAASLGAIAIALLVVAPWHLRVAAIGDGPHNLRGLYLHDTAQWERWEPHRSLQARDVSLVSYTVEEWPSIVSKTARNAARFGRDLAMVPAPGVGLIGLAAILVGLRRRRRDATGFALAAAGLVIFISPLEYGARFMAPLVPALAIGVAGATRDWGRWATLIGLVAVAIGFGWSANRYRAPRFPATNVVRTLAASSPTDGRIIVSDTPTLVAWMWDRPAVWTPRPNESVAVAGYLSR